MKNKIRGFLPDIIVEDLICKNILCKCWKGLEDSDKMNCRYRRNIIKLKIILISVKQIKKTLNKEFADGYKLLNIRFS
jgi:hypothetical protein